MCGSNKENKYEKEYKKLKKENKKLRAEINSSVSTIAVTPKKV
jgi:hypothetical protein